MSPEFRQKTPRLYGPLACDQRIFAVTHSLHSDSTESSQLTKLPTKSTCTEEGDIHAL